MARGKSYAVGYSKTPARTRFEKGKSGNPKGRPKGARNFDTVIGEELDGSVPITEGGRRKRVSKRVVIAKQLVLKATAGDLKATQTIFNETRFRETAPVEGGPLADIPDHESVIADIVRRIRLMDPPQINSDVAAAAIAKSPKSSPSRVRGRR